MTTKSLALNSRHIFLTGKNITRLKVTFIRILYFIQLFSDFIHVNLKY